MKETFNMSESEIDRVKVFLQLKAKTISQSEAAEILQLSVRQIKRLFKKFQQSGVLALLSKKRGAGGNHRVDAGIKDLIIALIKDKYLDFGPTLAHEKLKEDHKLRVSISLVRKVMIENSIWEERKAKKKTIYQLRKRRPREGELIQADGSPHAWFEDRGPACCLIHCVDDATGKIMAGLFVPSESTWSYFKLFTQYLKQHGLPLALYVDKHGVFKVNAKEALSGSGITQFGRAMKELDIKLIYANTPQAKGRIERSNQTLQDRLVKELRLKHISDMEKANEYLSTFFKSYNRKFAVLPTSSANAHRPLLASYNLDLIFTKREFRILSKNLTFQYENIIYQLVTDRETYAMRYARVEVRENEEGIITVFYKGKRAAYSTHSRQERQGDILSSKELNQALEELLMRGV